MEKPNDDSTIAVGLGEIKICSDPSKVLVAYGLGSCIGLGAYDSYRRIAGLLHAVLPISNGSEGSTLGRYVNTGIPALIAQMEDAGASRRHTTFRMVGGANIITSPGFEELLNIGDRNINIARKVLAELDVEILAEDVGGNAGRTVHLYIRDGKMTVRTLGQGEKEL